MKKILCILLCMMLCISALCACTSNKNNTSDDHSDASVETPSVDISYDEVSYIVPGVNDSSVAGNDSSESSEGQPNESNSSEQSELSSESSTEGPNSGETSDPGEQQTGGFAVKSKTYAYQGNNVAILDVKNETNKNYSVTVKASYLDANGKVLKAETQEFEQFASGYQKYFLFRPNIKFDKFTYEFETKEFNGACPICDLVIEKANLIEVEMPVAELINKGNYSKYPSIIANLKTQNKGNATFRIGYMYTIAIGNDGKIFYIDQNAPTEYTPHMENDRVAMFYYTTNEKLVWPDVLKGDVTILTVINSISDEDWLAAIS